MRKGIHTLADYGVKCSLSPKQSLGLIEPQPKTILVLSKRDRTPLVADFTCFQSDKE